MKSPLNDRRSRLLKSTLAVGALLCVPLLSVPATGNTADDAKTRVLFIGNSLTSANDLPGAVTELAKARGHTLECEAHVPGGYRLSQHATTPGLLEKIKQGGWDFVILQEQSQLPAFAESQLQAEMYPYAQKLSELVRQGSPKAQVVFYMTMAKKNGDQMNSKFVPEVATYQGMQDRIIASYTQMAQQNQARLAPVGLVWKKVHMNQPSFALYADETHPSPTGTYLAACVLYATIFKDTVTGLPSASGIDPAVARYLQKATDETITSQSWDWGGTSQANEGNGTIPPPPSSSAAAEQAAGLSNPRNSDLTYPLPMTNLIPSEATADPATPAKASDAKSLGHKTSGSYSHEPDLKSPNKLKLSHPGHTPGTHPISHSTTVGRSTD